MGIDKETANQHSRAELIILRASADKPNMGLTTWKNSPKGVIRKADALIAKNYLSEDELSEMNSLVSQFLEYADRQARRRIPMTMKDWEQKLNDILKINDKVLLETVGTVSHQQAVNFAETEYLTYMEREADAEKIRSEDDFSNLVSDALNLKYEKDYKPN